MADNADMKGKMGLWGIMFFVFSGLIGIDGLTPAAAVGPSIVGWMAVVVILFVLPYVLIVCELSAAYPGEGAVYDWTLRAMGPRSAARVSWYYWINVPFWIPAVYLICSGMIAELFFPEMGTWTMIGIAIVLVWLTIFACNASLEMGNLINAIGGISKIAVLLAFAIGGILLISSTGGGGRELTVASMMPTMGDSFMYAPTLIYLFLGVETVSCMGASIRNPQRDLPAGILISIGVIILLYILSITAMIAAVPAEELSLVGGIVQTFNVLFGDSAAAKTLVLVLSLTAVFGLFTYIIPWVMAASRAAAEAADAGEMPAIFGKKNKHDAPEGANMLTGYVATAALVIYGFMAGDADDLFWSLFSFSSVLLFITYFFFFSAFVKLRKMDPDAPRPFRVPGGDGAALIIALIPAIILAFGSVLFVFPDILMGSIDWAFSTPTLVAIIIAAILIEVSIHNKMKGKAANAATDSDSDPEPDANS